MKTTQSFRDSDEVITPEQAKEIVVATLQGLLNERFSGRDDRRVFTATDFTAAREATKVALEKKYGPHHEFFGAVDSALLNTFASVLGKTGEGSGVIMSPAQVAALVTRAGQDVSEAVDAKIQAMQPGFSEAAAAIGRLKAAGKWEPGFERAGLAQVFREAGRSHAIVTVRTTAGIRKQSVLRALESLVAEVVPPKNLRDSHLVVDSCSRAFAEAADERARKREISFGDAMRELRSEGFTVKADGSVAFEPQANITPGSGLALASVELAEAARKRSLDLDISYGQALTELRSRGFGG